MRPEPSASNDEPDGSGAGAPGSDADSSHSSGSTGVPAAGSTRGPAHDDAAKAGLRALHQTEYRNMVGLARFLVDDLETAEEIAQDAFVRLYQSWDKVEEPSKRLPYLRTIVRNLARSRLRHRRVARDNQPAPPPHGEPAETGALAGEDRSEVLEALTKLSTRQREVVVLRFYHDMKLHEIAAELDLSEGAVKSHLHRALTAMADELEGSR
ncbi:MAG: hypothetical protein JJLCMIEE_00913 [Acidimicrobiales bacterium]|nr:MAG: SigE family RNA polymerase sigma factor [Actinomycetota bacterium]MBV6507855.1 hypothetical protein [Acidimicrobiales bacterium]RIK06001.1 MAG: SigE family RNA polymerase sigma factor [Acidobacteriota bacterium]